MGPEIELYKAAVLLHTLFELGVPVLVDTSALPLPTIVAIAQDRR